MNGATFYSARGPLLAILLLLLVIAGFLATANEREVSLALTTLRIAGLTSIFALSLGMLLAVLLVKTDVPLKSCWLLALCVLLFLPLYVQASAWDAGFGQQGWFSQWIGRTAEPLLRGEAAVLWIHTLAAVPWVVLIVGASLRQVEGDLEELALMDAGPWQVLLWVTLPQTLPGIIAAGLLVLVTTASEMTVTDVYRVRTYAEELYTNLALTADATEATIGIWPQLATIGVLVVIAWQVAEMLAPRGERSSQRSRVSWELGIWRWPCWLLIALFTLVAIGVPLGNLVYKAGFTVDVSSGAPERTWTMATAMDSTMPGSVDPSHWKFGKEYGVTLQLGAFVGTLSVLLAIPLAWLARGGGVRSWPALGVTVIGLALPGPLIGVSIVWLFNQPQAGLLAWLYDRTLLPSVLAITVRTLPWATMLLWHAFRSLGEDQIESARTEGAGPLAILGRIVLPQRGPMLAIVWLGCFALAAGDLTASILVVPPGMVTIAYQIFLLIHAGVHNEEAGLCLTQVALFVALAGGVLWMANTNPQRTKPGKEAK